jgi:hypothetical protein
MSLEHLNWRYVGSQSFASATVAAVLDAIYTLGTTTTYANGATRTEGTGSAWTYTGNRYQNAGTTEALYPAPPTSTLNGRILLAGAATLPSPNPTMASPDAAAANILLANVVKNAGAFATWNAASPMTSGQTFGYWRVWPTSAGTGSVYLYEGKDAMLVVISAGAAAYAWIGGATLMWTVDGGWVERHDGFRSILAGPAGESDTWRLDLRVVDDFRPAGVGGNTAFTCNAVVSALVWVKDLAGEVSDCRQLGAVVEPLLAEEASPPCPTVWEEPADTDG